MALESTTKLTLDPTPVTACRLCGSTDLSLVLDYGYMPFAGAFVERGDPRLQLRAPLTLLRCPRCTLLQTGQHLDSDATFSTYSYTSSAAPSLVRHFEKLARHLVSTWHVRGRLVVDIGCNDGVLLKPLQERGVIAIGIDPSDVALRAAVEGEWVLYGSYMTAETARTVIGAHGRAALVTACNVLAHTDSIHDMLDGVQTLLDRDGLFVAEVHYQGDLLNLVQFDTVYHEHTCYYSLTALDKLFTQHGLHIWHVERIATHAGSIRVYACHTARRQTRHPTVDGMLHDEKPLLDTWAFQKRALRAKHVLGEVISDLARFNRVYAYGAAGRATILLNWCDFDDDAISQVLDISPLRIGKLVPGVEIPIVRVQELEIDPPDYCLITAWNYEASIRSQHRDYAGGWITPLPEVKIV